MCRCFWLARTQLLCTRINMSIYQCVRCRHRRRRHRRRRRRRRRSRRHSAPCVCVWVCVADRPWPVRLSGIVGDFVVVLSSSRRRCCTMDRCTYVHADPPAAARARPLQRRLRRRGAKRSSGVGLSWRRDGGACSCWRPAGTALGRARYDK